MLIYKILFFMIIILLGLCDYKRHKRVTGKHFPISWTILVGVFYFLITFSIMNLLSLSHKNPILVENNLSTYPVVSMEYSNSVQSPHYKTTTIRSLYYKYMIDNELVENSIVPQKNIDIKILINNDTKNVTIRQYHYEYKRKEISKIIFPFGNLNNHKSDDIYEYTFNIPEDLIK